ncbi:hypothetical protein BR93DRAFT_926041 [Coniochaeta sp. PMI_546]|nr:hypothetical protein BR93DRAFT_926041 [Coniochaeta sp. PMI_546]
MVAFPLCTTSSLSLHSSLSRYDPERTDIDCRTARGMAKLRIWEISPTCHFIRSTLYLLYGYQPDRSQVMR